MNILIVSATDKEINPLVKHFRLLSKESSKLKKYSYKKHSIDVLITGVGMVATTYQLTKAITNKKYVIALNLGIAGSFEKKLKIGTVVNITEDCFSELGAEDGDEFISLLQMDLMKEDEFPFTKGKLLNFSKIKNTSVNALPKVKGITLNKVHGNEASIKRTVKRFSPQVESMEGAAFLYVCMLEKRACLQIRAISNHVEKRDREKWNIPLAIENLNQKAIEILNHFL